MTASGRALAPWMIVTAVMTAACSPGTSGTESGGGGGSPTASSPALAYTALDPAQFAAVAEDETAYVVNVHVPDEGSIAGTDEAIPYDEVRDRAAEFPQSRSARIAVYCQTGRMSTEAAATLAHLGYTDVIELSGGMQAWEAAGRDLLPPGN